MESKIDFSTYSLGELYSSAETINREKYPDRAKEIDNLIAARILDHPEEIDNTKNIGERATKSDRLMSAIIDGFIGMLAMVPVFYFFGLDAFAELTLELIGTLFIYGIFITFTLHGYLLYHYGQTIGKNFMSIRIENLDGSKASFSTIYFKRMLPMQLVGLIPSFGTVISGFVNPLFIFGKQRRCLHDYIAKTKVSYTS